MSKVPKRKMKMVSKLVLILVPLFMTIGCFVQGFVAPVDSTGVIRKPPVPKPSNVILGFGGSQECVHANTTYGRRIPGDWKAYSEIFNKSKSFFRKVSVEVKYPSNGSKSYCPISCINVENLYRKCKCYKETVEIKAGGIGKQSTTLKITSDSNCPNEHRVTVYTRC